MRRSLPKLCSAAFAFLSFTSLHAQDQFAYAITDLSKEGAGWNALRKLDLQTGQYSDVLINGTDANTIVFDAATKKQLLHKADARFGNSLQTPFSTGVAAAAYDKKHNRLYFTPMFIDQLRYVDLRTMKVYYVSDHAFTNTGHMHGDEGKIITRMVIAPDGYGYAISNDGNTFLRFSTGKKAEVQQLGALVDDPSNGGISVHNRCTSFGGDMIADDEGNLYIISARNHVFTVNTENKVAKHLGSIQNLPANFTVNGAVVDGDGALLVSSAVDGSSYYVVNPKEWSASPYKTAGSIFRSSDLANSNFLASRGPLKPELTNVQMMPSAESKYSKLISVYPNPVTDNNIVLQFNKVPSGDYTVELTDILGRSVMQQRVLINNESQVQTLRLNPGRSSGTYLVRIVDRDNSNVFSQKVLVQ